MGTVTIPNRPTGSDPRAIADILANFDAITAQMNGNIDNTNVAAAAAIVGSKLDTIDGRLKVTSGVVGASSNLATTTSYADVPGMTATVTCDVASYLFVATELCWAVSWNTASVGVHLDALWAIDGVDQTTIMNVGHERSLAGASGTWLEQSSSVALTRLTLAPGSRTVKVRAKHTLTSGTLVSSNVVGSGTPPSRFIYLLVAQ